MAAAAEPAPFGSDFATSAAVLSCGAACDPGGGALGNWRILRSPTRVAGMGRKPKDAESQIEPLARVSTILRGSREVAHQLLGGLTAEPNLVDRLRHAGEPKIPLVQTDRNMRMHLSQMRMSVFLHVILRAAKKAGQEIELFDPGVGDAVAPKMEQMQLLCIRVRLDDVVECLHQIANPLLAADAVVERLLLLQTVHNRPPSTIISSRRRPPGI